MINVSTLIQDAGHTNLFSTSNPYIESFRSYNGLYCFCTKNDTDGWKQHFIDDFNQIYELVEQYKDTHDCYLAQATFKSKSRTTGNVQELNKLFIDIDSDNAHSLAKNECEQLYTLLLEYDVPQPTFSVFTGHGLQIVWNTQGIELKDWEMYENNLHKLIENAIEDIKNNSMSNIANRLIECDVHLDNCVKDKSRVLRIPNTRNTKDARTDLYAELLDHDITVTLTDTELVQYELNVPETKAFNHHTTITKGCDSVVTDKCTTFVANEWLNKFIKPRLDDLYTLIELRNEAGHTSGYRNELVKYAVMTCHNMGMNKEQAMKELEKLNSTFTDPLPAKEYKDWIKCTYSLRNTEDGYKVGAIVKTRTIIEHLDISSAEQEHMKMLISYDEKENRRKNKREAKKEANRKKKQERNNKILNMYSQGFCKTQISQIMGISRPTIDKVINSFGHELSVKKSVPNKGKVLENPLPDPNTSNKGEENMTEDKRFKEFKKQVNELFEDYEKGLETEPATAEKKEIPEELKEKMSVQGLYMVEHMLKVGMYEPDELYKKGTINSIMTNEKTILANNSSREAVNKCIDRVMREYNKGTVKSLNKYFQTSLQKLKKDD